MPGVEASGEETANSTTSSLPAGLYRCQVSWQEPRRSASWRLCKAEKKGLARRQEVTSTEGSMEDE